MGVIIDERLDWKNHIDICKNKLSSGIYAINLFKNAMPTIQLKTLYYTLIHPYLTYGVLLWGVALKKTTYTNYKFYKTKRCGKLPMPNITIQSMLCIMN